MVGIDTVSQQSATSLEMLLGSGRSLVPPEGWLKTGFITENELGLEPKSQMRWCPVETQAVFLHWWLSSSPLPQESMMILQDLVSRVPGWIAIEQILPLYPALIRMPLHCLTRARIVPYPGNFSMLGVEYFIREKSMVGIVFYAPSLHEYGEYEALAYEGTEPAYSQYWKFARNALETYSRLAEGGAGHAGQPNIEPPLLRSAEHSSSKTADEIKKIRAKLHSPESQSSASNKLRRKTAELSRLGTEVHILKPGETIKKIVNERWPHLDEGAREVKHREISALNRIHSNPIETWNLQPGMRILLPID